MTSPLPNPFEVTKATDLTDDQIHEFWVDLAGDGLAALVKPKSLVPMFIMGGKGSGKTHLLRHFAHSLQRRRGKGDLGTRVAHEGYLGLYMKCGGLNASRFEGKGQPSDTWADVFAYYMELWVAQYALEALQDLCAKAPEAERKIARCIASQAPDALGRNASTLAELSGRLKQLQDDADRAINNAALTRRLELGAIPITRGVLVFGIPEAVQASAPVFSKIVTLYLFDEFEILGTHQQKYINSLVRDRTGPCSFRVGSRLYGIRTRETLGAGEPNREGSEFEAVHLDSILRANRKYPDFAIRLCAKRLAGAGYLQVGEEELRVVARSLEDTFEHRDDARLIEQLAAKSDGPSPGLTSLKQKLLRHYSAGRAAGVSSAGDVDTIVDRLRLPGNGQVPISV